MRCATKRGRLPAHERSGGCNIRLNVFLQAMLSTRGPSYACWERVARRDVTLFITPYILAEIRKLPSHRRLQRFVDFTMPRVERFIEELLDVAVLIPDPPSTFEYARDPADAHYVDVALSTKSLLIITNDNDLLDLMKPQNREGVILRERYPAFQVLSPPQFLQVCRAAGGSPG